MSTVLWLTLLLGGGSLLLIALYWHLWRRKPHTDTVHRMLSKMMRIRKVQSAYHAYGEWLKKFDDAFRENIQTHWRPADWKKHKSLYKYN